MKKALLFAILAISITAFAQTKHPLPISKGDIQDRLKDGGCLPAGQAGRMEDACLPVRPGIWRTSDIRSERKFEQALRHQTLQQRDLIQIFDSIYFWQWDTLSIGLKIYYKNINMAYDASNNLTRYTGQSWNGSIWVNNWQCTSTYDANNNQTSFIGQGWNGSDWANQNQYIYTYDANNNQTSELWQYWNSISWVDDGQLLFTYDANNNRTSELYQQWNDSVWKNVYQYVYTYDPNNNQTSDLRQNWNGTAWENDWQHINTY
jgi:hypothetical protein